MERLGKNPVARLHVGDRCFEESWRTARQALYRRALRLTRGDQGRAEELLSVTALKSLEVLRRIPERIRDPQGFLFLVLRHVHLDSARQEAREKRVFDKEAMWRMEEEGKEIPGGMDETRTPLDIFLVAERLESLSRAFGYLKPRQRALFDLFFLQECAYPEIAQALDISAALARKRVQLLRERLRTLTKSSQN